MRGAPDVAASRAGSAESPVTVLCFDGDSLDRAQGLSDRLDAPLAVCEPGCSGAAFIPELGLLYLKVSRDGLSLMRDGMELRPDFAEMLPRIKQGALQREMLVKAARVKGVEVPRAVDATAGLGEDSLLLAAAGFTVTLCEADPVIAALLEDALARPVELDSRELLDGGIANSIPAAWMVAQGYDRNVVVLTQPAGFVKEPNRLMPLLKRAYGTYPKLVELLANRHVRYNAQLEEVARLERDGKALVIRPSESVKAPLVVKDPEILERIYQVGRRDGEARIADVRCYLA